MSMNSKFTKGLFGICEMQKRKGKEKKIAKMRKMTCKKRVGGIV